MLHVLDREVDDSNLAIAIEYHFSQVIIFHGLSRGILAGFIDKLSVKDVGVEWIMTKGK